MELRRRDLDPDPLRQFERWYAEAGRAQRWPERVALATATRDGAPSLRMVLLKSFDEGGLVFFTHTTSRKGRELAANPRAALLLYWDSLGRQVRVEGSVQQVSAHESDAYFATRPPGAQAGAVASRQSEVLASRDELEAPRRSARRLAGRAPGDLGRLSRRARRVGVLAAPGRPPPRPLSLPARLRRLGHRTALSLSDRPSLARRSSQAPPTPTIQATASPSGSGVTS